MKEGYNFEVRFLQTRRGVSIDFVKCYKNRGGGIDRVLADYPTDRNRPEDGTFERLTEAFQDFYLSAADDGIDVHNGFFGPWDLPRTILNAVTLDHPLVRGFAANLRTIGDRLSVVENA